MSNKKHQNYNNNSPGDNQPDFNNLNHLANELDAICRRRLPDGKIRSGILAGREPELRQIALSIALGGFLQNNAGYIRAENRLDAKGMRDSLEKCAALTLRISKNRLARHLSTQAERQTLLTEFNCGTCQHPAQIHPSDWPWALKAGVASKAAAQAVETGKLSRINGVIVSMICTRNASVVEIAKTLKVSTNAVYQRLSRIRPVIREEIKSIEVI